MKGRLFHASVTLIAMLLLVGCGSPAPDQTAKMAQDFNLPDGNGNLVSLDAMLAEHQSVVLVFYHSHT